jgi:sugar diacid utilization regulator
VDGLVTRLRAVHLEMVDAVLSGDGLEQVAELAAGAAGAPVVLVVPRLGALAAGPPGAVAREQLTELEGYVSGRLRDRPAQVPVGIVAEVPVAAGDELLGAAFLLAGGTDPDPAAAEFVHLAAVAALTEVAVDDARSQVEDDLRGSLVEELRGGMEADPAEVVRRAGRLGCDLRAGAVVLCAEPTTDRPRHLAAVATADYQGALAQHADGRVYALLPAAPDRSPEQAVGAARALAGRLRRHGTVGVSSFYTDPAELHRAVQEAELVLDVVRRGDAAVAEEVGEGAYRLLFRVLASHPEEVRSFYEDTVAPVVRYDDQYGTDLMATLASYLHHDCNMNATAAAIYAHRHTVAYRLDRVRELSGLDPTQSEDRERLGLGLKAHRIIAPTLPR